MLPADMILTGQPGSLQRKSQTHDRLRNARAYRTIAKSLQVEAGRNKGTNTVIDPPIGAKLDESVSAADRSELRFSSTIAVESDPRRPDSGQSVP